MKKYGGMLIFAVVLAGAMAFMSPRTDHITIPLYAQEIPAVADDLRVLPWLHVEVETSYGWFWQKSKGHAWVTEGKQDTTPVKVANLCIRLAAHDTTLKCEPNTDEIMIQEKKRGVQIKKHTAIVTAWAENPNLDSVTVKMEP